MKKLIIILIVLVIVISAMCSFDYNRVKAGEKPIFAISTKSYNYEMGTVYEYSGFLYKIVDAREISDFSNIMVSTVFKKTKSFDILAGEELDMRGSITNNQMNGSILVENTLTDKTEYKVAWVDINDSTIILSNKTKKIIDRRSIPNSATVEVAFTKVYKNEDPIRGVAKFIILLD